MLHKSRAPSGVCTSAPPTSEPYLWRDQITIRINIAKPAKAFGCLKIVHHRPVVEGVNKSSSSFSGSRTVFVSETDGSKVLRIESNNLSIPALI